MLFNLSVFPVGVPRLNAKVYHQTDGCMFLISVYVSLMFVCTLTLSSYDFLLHVTSLYHIIEAMGKLGGPLVPQKIQCDLNSFLDLHNG